MSIPSLFAKLYHLLISTKKLKTHLQPEPLPTSPQTRQSIVMAFPQEFSQLSRLWIFIAPFLEFETACIYYSFCWLTPLFLITRLWATWVQKLYLSHYILSGFHCVWQQCLLNIRTKITSTACFEHDDHSDVQVINSPEVFSFSGVGGVKKKGCWSSPHVSLASPL